jgi:hypothetical protein
VAEITKIGQFLPNKNPHLALDLRKIIRGRCFVFFPIIFNLINYLEYFLLNKIGGIMFGANKTGGIILGQIKQAELFWCK